MMNSRWNDPLRVLPLALFASACSGEIEEAPPPYLIRDSAGVEIVESRSPLWAPGEEWRVGTRLLELGASTGDSLYEFSWVSSVRRLPAGGVAAVDGASRVIRIYSADGSHVRAFGGEGNGPAEFGAPPELGPIRGDSLLAWDPGRRRMLRFRVDGTLIDAKSHADLLREARVPGGAGMPGEVSADGRVLIRALAPSPDLFKEDGLVERSVRPIAVSGTTGSFVALDPVPTGRSLMAGGRGIADPYAPYAPVTLGPSELPLIVGDATEWEIRFYGEEGDLRRIARAAVPRQPLTPELHERQRELAPERAAGTGMDRERVSVLFSQLPVPDSLPVLGELLLSRSGHLWVQRRSVSVETEDRAYDVIDAEGRWLGTVSVPSAIGTIREIGADYMLAVRADDLGVQSIVVVELVAGG